VCEIELRLGRARRIRGVASENWRLRLGESGISRKCGIGLIHDEKLLVRVVRDGRM
jgi:hypothetical protein